MDRDINTRTAPEYRTWVRMKNRCYNANTAGFHRYGGRGITVCERWRKSFKSFLADVGHKPSAAYSLDRIDNNGNYELGNVRWATFDVQCNNRRGNRPLTVNNKTQGVSAWAKALGCAPHIITMRLKRGWPVELAVSTPSNKGASRKITNRLRLAGVL
jgi:hypothetical protein